MHVRKSATTQGDRPALAVESFALEKIMSLADDLLALQRAEAERRTREADLAEALNALDANIRTLAEAVGGLRSGLQPRTAIGRLLQRLIVGTEEPHEHRS